MTCHSHFGENERKKDLKSINHNEPKIRNKNKPKQIITRNIEVKILGSVKLALKVSFKKKTLFRFQLYKKFVYVYSFRTLASRLAQCYFFTAFFHNFIFSIAFLQQLKNKWPFINDVAIYNTLGRICGSPSS